MYFSINFLSLSFNPQKLLCCRVLLESKLTDSEIHLNMQEVPKHEESSHQSNPKMCTMIGPSRTMESIEMKLSDSVHKLHQRMKASFKQVPCHRVQKIYENLEKSDFFS